MNIQEFMASVFALFDGEVDKSITDKLFCLIESDRTLLNNYLDILSEGPSQQLKITNSAIAKEIAKHYKLTTGVENKTPNSKLISSYHELN